MSMIHAQMDGHTYTLTAPASFDEFGTLRADFVDHLTGIHVPVAITRGESSEHIPSVIHANHGPHGHHAQPNCDTPEPSSLLIVPAFLAALILSRRGR